MTTQTAQTTQTSPAKTTARALPAKRVKSAEKPDASAARPAAVLAAKKVTTPAQVKPAKAKTVKKPLASAIEKSAAKPVAKTAKKTEPKLKKIKQVRDSFTMPETEYAALGQVKKACLKAGFDIKKSDLLRIGVSLIKNLETGKLKTLLTGLTPLKVGRPKK